MRAIEVDDILQLVDKSSGKISLESFFLRNFHGNCRISWLAGFFASAHLLNVLVAGLRPVRGKFRNSKNAKKSF